MRIVNTALESTRYIFADTIMCIPLWATSYVGLVVNIVPGDDVVETCGNRLTNSEDQSPVEGFPQQLQDFLTLFTGW